MNQHIGDHRPDDTTNDSAADHPQGVHGTSIGAGAGALAGMATGAIAGPLGAAVGAAIGALAGAAAGLGVDVAAASAVDPEEERLYWRDNYRHQDHYDAGYDIDDYEPAYALGYGSHGRFSRWDEAEPALRGEWENARQRSRLGWDRASTAARAAWERVQR